MFFHRRLYFPFAIKPLWKPHEIFFAERIQLKYKYFLPRYSSFYQRHYGDFWFFKKIRMYILNGKIRPVFLEKQVILN